MNQPAKAPFDYVCASRRQVLHAYEAILAATERGAGATELALLKSELRFCRRMWLTGVYERRKARGWDLVGQCPLPYVAPPIAGVRG